VKAPQKVTFNNQIVRATLVEDRIGLEGSVTTHYFSPDQVWLGSENKVTGVTVLPSDEKTLLALWKDANLTTPDAPPAREPGAPGAQPAAPAAEANTTSEKEAKPAPVQPAVPRLGLKPARR
jgi:hypothetical protein